MPAHARHIDRRAIIRFVADVDLSISDDIQELGRIALLEENRASRFVTGKEKRAQLGLLSRGEALKKG